MNMKQIKRKLDKVPIITIVLVSVNALIFMISDLTPLGGQFLYDYGELGYYPVIYQHQFYRIITCMFLHQGSDHIFNNMMMLITLGYYLENYLGHSRFLVLYFSSGFLAGCTSIVYNMIQMDTTPSVGASGATFGLMGAFIYILWRHQQELDIRYIVLALIVSFYNGFNLNGIDTAAHVGGFLFGIPCIALLDLTRNRKGRKTR